MIEHENIIYYSGPPFRPPGWDNPHNPHYPVPEFSSYGAFMALFLLAFSLIKRRRKVYNRED